jgi:hypothetical protein
MNSEMAYLLGMITGNGIIQRGNFETTITVVLPHKKLVTVEFHDVALYVNASLTNIRNVLDPLIGVPISTSQEKHNTIMSFSKRNEDYLIRELLQHINLSSTRNTMRVPNAINDASRDDKLSFLRGFSDVTAYIRRSNTLFGNPHQHRVYIEIPNNWFLVIDIANMLKTLDIPIQNIDWAHPNTRDSNLKKFHEGKPSFWKKEHQIKIFANEFLPIGFSILHKNAALETYANELLAELDRLNKTSSTTTHRFYWETRQSTKVKPVHPGESDPSLPNEIRGQHFNSWQEIASVLGYDKT